MIDTDVFANRMVVHGVLFCDGPVHQSGKQQLVFGNRGIPAFELTV